MRSRLSGLLFTFVLLLFLAACGPGGGEAGRGVAAGQPDGATATPAAAADTMATAVAAGIAATLDAQATADAAVVITPDAQPTAAPASPSAAPPTATATATTTATPSPTATITASPTPCQWALTADLNAFVRQGPGTNYDELGALQAGETVAIISRDASSSWWVIPFGGRDGWVADSVVSVNECPSDVPVSTPPATSTPTTTPTPLPTATSAYNPPPLIAEVEIVRDDDVFYPSSGHCQRGTQFTVNGLVSDASGIEMVSIHWRFQDYVYEDIRGPEQEIYWAVGEVENGNSSMNLAVDLDPTGQSFVGRYEQSFLIPRPQEYVIDGPGNDSDYLFRWVFWSIWARDKMGKLAIYEGRSQKMITCLYQ